MRVFQPLVLHAVLTGVSAISINAFSSESISLQARSPQDMSQLADLLKGLGAKGGKSQGKTGGKNGGKSGAMPKMSSGAVPKSPKSPKTSMESEETSAPATATGTFTPNTPAGPNSAGKAMIDSINAFREEKGMAPIKWSAKLAHNAYDTGKATGGKSMKHKLGPGSYGQVLVPGFGDEDLLGCNKNLNGYTPFELYYYSWLCEMPSDKALKGQCPKVLQMSRVNPAGQTGHYKLLTNTGFKSIGCAFFRNPSAKKCTQYAGIWGCDLGHG